MTHRIRRWTGNALLWIAAKAYRAAGYVVEPFQQWAVTVSYADGSKRRFTILNVHGVEWTMNGGAPVMCTFVDVHGNLLAAFDAASVVDAVRVPVNRGGITIGAVEA